MVSMWGVWGNLNGAGLGGQAKVMDAGETDLESIRHKLLLSYFFFSGLSIPLTVPHAHPLPRTPSDVIELDILPEHPRR